MANLDKFYTKPDIAEQCYDFLKQFYPDIGNEIFLEPSAGSGNFLTYLKNYEAYDIAPEGENIIKADFLSLELNRNDYVTIGNPPFGKRSKLAINFFNHAAKFSKIIAFILPVSFMKWGVHKELDSNFKLLAYKRLPENSFSDNGKDFSVRCVFQIWTKNDIPHNLRILKSPPIKHNDFNIWQYNATPQAMKYIDENWKYAVYRQGYKDYNHLFTKENYDFIKKQMINNVQFFFIEPLCEQAEQFVIHSDFEELAARNTSTPGFGKADFVSYYLQWLEENK